jgi:hypothetical protein
MPLHHDPVVPSWVVRRAPCASCLDSRGLCVSQSDGDGCVHRIRMVDGGRIPFRRHGCASQSDAMGCVERSGVGNVPIAPSTRTSMAWCAGH